MELNFSKYHGCGNDFICIDLRKTDIDLIPFAQKICERHFSVGADGVVVVLDSKIADYRMLIINADGSIPEMCGNGLRCFMAFLKDSNLITSDSILVETDAGVLPTTIVSSSDDQLMVKVQMGAARFGDALPKQDFNFDSSSLINISLDIPQGIFHFTPVSMGNPHAVIFVSNLDKFDVEGIGSVIESHPWFPNKVNVEFVEVISPNQYKMRVWERGVGETNACGTGACASVVAGVLSKKGLHQVQVILKGGALDIHYLEDSSHIEMLGPAKFIFSSRIKV